MRSEDIALGISVSSEEEEEEAAEEAQSEVDTLKQEVSELRQLLIAQVGGRAALALWTGVPAVCPRWMPLLAAWRPKSVAASLL